LINTGVVLPGKKEIDTKKGLSPDRQVAEVFLHFQPGIPNPKPVPTEKLDIDISCIALLGRMAWLERSKNAETCNIYRHQSIKM
jgi:hypothetical protein